MPDVHKRDLSSDENQRQQKGGRGRNCGVVRAGRTETSFRFAFCFPPRSVINLLDLIPKRKSREEGSSSVACYFLKATPLSSLFSVSLPQSTLAYKQVGSVVSGWSRCTPPEVGRF